MLTLRKLFDDAAYLCGFENANLTPVVLRERILADVVGCLQLMQSAGPDFYGRESVTITLSTGVASYTLGEEVQTVLHPARLVNSPPLRRIDTRAQFDQFAPLFLGQATVEDGTPLAYFVESLHTTGDDNVQIKVHLAPAPTVGQPSLVLDVIKEPPTYTTANLCDDTVPPVPHKYHELILRPLVRWEVKTYRYFQRADLLESLKIDYERSLRMLGMADPRIAKRNEPKPDETLTQPTEKAA